MFYPAGRIVGLTHGQRHIDGSPTTGWCCPPCLWAFRRSLWDRDWRRRKAALKAAQPGRTRDIYYIVSLDLVERSVEIGSGLVIAKSAATDSEAMIVALARRVRE